MFAALESVLEVLPVSRAWTSIVLEGDVRAAGDDFEVLENPCRHAFTDKVDESEQLGLWQNDEAWHGSLGSKGFPANGCASVLRSYA